jgi:hypothetical protein
MYTSNRHVCTLVGSLADTPDYRQLVNLKAAPAKPVLLQHQLGQPVQPSPSSFVTILYLLALNEGLDGGNDFRKNMYSQLHAFRTDNKALVRLCQDAHIDQIQLLLTIGKSIKR